MKRLLPLSTLIAIASLGLPAFADSASLPARAPSSTVSVSAQSFDLHDAIRLYAQHAGINVYIDDSVPHKLITYRMVGVDDRDALNTILKANDLGSTERNGILYVATQDVLTKRYGASSAVTVTLHLLNSDPTTVAGSLALVLPKDTIIFPDTARRALVLQGTPQAIAQARLFLGLDTHGNPTSENVLVTRLVPVRNGSDAKTIMAEAAVQIPVQPPNSITVTPNANTIVLYGSQAFVDAQADLIAKLDNPLQQVLYTASIIEVTPTNDTDTQGFLYGGYGVNGTAQVGSGSTVYAFASKSLPLTVQIDALLNKGTARVLERPTVLTTNNATGSVTFGTDIPIVVQDAITGVSTVRTVTAGVNLSVTPTIGTDVLTTKITTSYSDETGTGQGGYPIIARRTVDSTVVTKTNDVIVISGLYEDTNTLTIQGVPYLSKLPIVGGLFSHKASNKLHNEVLVVLTPHVYNVQGSRTLPIGFPSVDPQFISNGIVPATPAPSATPTPLAHPAPMPAASAAPMALRPPVTRSEAP